MFQATRDWFRRNRARFAFGVGVLGVGYVATQYLLSKISEARERMSIDRIARENLRRRFDQNQEDCTFTVLALLPTATENILEALPVESITQELQQKKAERLARSGATSEAGASELSGPPSTTDDDGRSLQSFQSDSFVHTSQLADARNGAAEGHAGKSRRSKVQMWNELKIGSITRVFTLLYTLALLNLLTRIQLNLLGRRNYMSSVVNLASYHARDSKIVMENHDDDDAAQAYGNDFDTNRRYLTFSWWLLHRGWKEVMQKVEIAVSEVFGPVNPREDVTLERLSKLTLDVRKRVEGEDEEQRRNMKWLPYLLPPRSQEDAVLQESGMISENTSTSTESASSPLRRLLDETSDLIDSPPFSKIITKILDAGFCTLIDERLAIQAFKLPPGPPPPAISPDGEVRAQKTAKLANILAVITRQAHSVGNGMPNEYLQAMEAVRDLEAFAAIVYSSNFDFETPSGQASATDLAESGASSREVETLPTYQSSVGIENTDNPISDSSFEKAWSKVMEEQGSSDQQKGNS